jgi:transcriptional regulator of acetoin/glycerol metabolism
MAPYSMDLRKRVAKAWEAGLDADAVAAIGQDVELALQHSDIPILITARDLGVRRRLAQHIHNHSCEAGTFVMLHSVEEWEFAPSQVRQATLFIDDVATCDLKQQAALMRLLNCRTKTAAIRWRIIAASDERLFDAMSDGRFRADLYYRLAMMHIVIAV